jgi:hypothetical protein
MLNDQKPAASPIPKKAVTILDRAVNVSKYAGVAWGIQSGNRADIKQTKYGLDVTPLFHDLTQSQDADALYLSTPIDTGFADPLLLGEAICSSGIKNIYLPTLKAPFSKYFSKQSLNLPLGMTTHHYAMPNIGHRLLCGAFNLRTLNRPWLSCISSTSLVGNDIPLVHFGDEFGVPFGINQVITQSMGVIYFKQPKTQFEWLTKNRNEQIQDFYVKNIQELKKLCAHLCMMNCASMTIIASFSDTQHLLQAGFLDEVIYHVKLFETNRKTQCLSSSNLVPVLEGWQITDCSQLENSIRVSTARSYC